MEAGNQVEERAEGVGVGVEGPGRLFACEHFKKNITLHGWWRGFGQYYAFKDESSFTNGLSGRSIRVRSILPSPLGRPPKRQFYYFSGGRPGGVLALDDRAWLVAVGGRSRGAAAAHSNRAKLFSRFE